MVTVKNFEVLKHLPNTPTEGEYAICTDTSEVYQYTDNNWIRVEHPDAKLNIDLYELNKTLYRSMPEMTFNELQKKKKEIKLWSQCCGDEYFMLLNRELADYTVFSIDGVSSERATDSFEQEVTDIVCSRGRIKSIEINNEELWIQFWVEQDKEIYMYALFPYDNGVITCRR